MDALVISRTPVNREPRLIRQVGTLKRAGFRVFVAGFHDPSNLPLACEFLDLNKQPLSESTLRISSLRILLGGFLKSRLLPSEKGMQIVLGFFLRVGRGFLPRKSLVRIHLFFVKKIYRTNEEANQIRQFLREKGAIPTIIVAHDIHGINISREIAGLETVPLLADLHEHFPTQYSFLPKWQAYAGPLIEETMRELLKQVSGVSTVSEGIRNAYLPLLRAGLPNWVIRSVQEIRAEPTPRTDDEKKVIYSGLITPGRGLELLIASVQEWDDEFSLTIMGPADNSFLEELRDLVVNHGLEERIHFRQPVEFSRLVPVLSSYDIGVFVQPDTGVQKRFTLPNKLFDYIAAGLAVCISNYPEMARIVIKARNGELVQTYSAESLAVSMSKFSKQRLAEYKRASQNLSKRLNWQTEEKLFLDAVVQLARE